MDRRNFLMRLSAICGLQGCVDTYPADFSIEWDEEVKLHDGSMLLVHIRRYFWRRNQRVQWDALYMGTEISFDMGPPRGVYQRDFKGYQVVMIDRQGSDWYIELVKTGGGIGPRPALVDERFPVLILSADGSERSATSWNDVPPSFAVNIRLMSDDFEGLSKLNKQRLRWGDKTEFRKSGA